MNGWAGEIANDVYADGATAVVVCKAVEHRARREGAKGDPGTILQKTDNSMVKWEHYELVEAADAARKYERRRDARCSKARPIASGTPTLRPPHRIIMRLLLPLVKGC